MDLFRNFDDLDVSSSGLNDLRFHLSEAYVCHRRGVHLGVDLLEASRPSIEYRGPCRIGEVQVA